jgi:hypothetical protein
MLPDEWTKDKIVFLEQTAASIQADGRDMKRRHSRHLEVHGRALGCMRTSSTLHRVLPQALSCQRACPPLDLPQALPFGPFRNYASHRRYGANRYAWTKPTHFQPHFQPRRDPGRIRVW